MLHLAQTTDGVIVTNDNLRDLLDESQAWKDIIKKRSGNYAVLSQQTDRIVQEDQTFSRQSLRIAAKFYISYWIKEINDCKIYEKSTRNHEK